MDFRIVLAGQPNVGKSSLINAISGAKLRVGNFSGVTVEKAEAIFEYKNHKITMIDLPGTYSLNGYTMEEKVTKDFLEKESYDLILNVVDSTNLERNLMLTLQLKELKKDMLIALNMIDEADKDGIKIDTNSLSESLGCSVCAVSSSKAINLESLLDSIISAMQKKPSEEKHDSKVIFKPTFSSPSKDSITQSPLKTSKALIAKNIANKAQKLPPFIAKGTSKIDSILLHRFWSIPIFLLAMFAVFEVSFVLGKYLQDLLQAGVDSIGDYVGEMIENELLSSLIGDGIIKGVGTVISFLPLIAMLFLGLTLLESSGYMARVAFMLDGIFFRFGLHGKSFVPLVMGFGCSVPAYIATRALQNQREKLLTLFIIGFMSCSARLPIYLLFVGAFFSAKYAGLVLFCIYLGGFLIALILAKILRIFVFRGQSEPFVMEMPRYRIPSLKVVWFSVWSKSYLFLKKAGTVILVGAIFVWALANFPKSDEINNEYESKIESLATLNLTDEEREERAKMYENEMLENQLQYSFAGRAGSLIEPIFSPLGFDWRLSVSLITGFSAKELVVSTLGVLYALGESADEDEDKNQSLQEILQDKISLPTAIAFIMFIMLYIPCFAATISFGHESGKKIYMLYLFLFTSAVAYLFAFIGYRISLLLVGA